MSNSRSDSGMFEAFTRELLKAGLRVRFEARGASMSPCIRDGEIVHITPVIVSKLRKDDIVLARSNNSFRVHRLVLVDQENDTFVTRGDCGQQDDPAVRGEEILGIATAKEVRVGRRVVRAKFDGLGGRLLRGAARSQYLLMKVLSSHRAERPRSSTGVRTILGLFSLLAVLFAASYSRSQVAVDATTSTAGLSPAGTFTGTFTHTTGAGANRLLIVSVAFDTTQSPGTLVDGITYNGTALTLLGTHNDAGNTRRVEMWYLLNPVSGSNLIVAVTLTVPTGGATIGAVAGATTFTGVDQTVPLSAFFSADGANGGNSQLDVPSVVNGMVFDTLATGGDQTITVPGPQVTQWNLNSGGNTASPDVQSSGSSRSGAPSVPISETFSGTSNWALGAVSINPTSADLSVTNSVPTAVFLGVQNPTYTITVKNNGPSAANNVIVKDTWAATGLTLGTVTTTSGTCTGTAPITCTLATPMAAGATVTITVPVTASAAGSYANTAVVSDSNTPPDPNTGNNSSTAVATVQSLACGTTSQATAAVTPLTGVLNTYYPGTASVAAGAKSISVGTATGAGTAIATGNLLLVIQMQDASINDSNSVSYGNGSSGQGFTALNSAGDYEFVTATGPVAAGKVPISGAGSGGGLVFAYHSAAWSTNAGQSTFQVIVVPQYTTATFNATTAPTALAWNGSTGGVLVLDTSSILTLNGATLSVDGLGFRGGAGLQLTGATGAITDYVHVAPGTYTGAAKAGTGAPKGEGIAGTPLWIESGGTYANTGSDYPSGTAGTDGSSARGAPANAGGGGTDGDPPANDE
ncbi:MAG: CARDB domain-containing protein, partial [Candidatus Sulfotelmatobacter sp.]